MGQGLRDQRAPVGILGGLLDTWVPEELVGTPGDRWTPHGTREHPQSS